MKKRDRLGPDFTAFLSIIFMVAGALLVLLLSNTASLLANPDAVVISSLLHSRGLAPGGELSSGIGAFAGAVVVGGNTNKVPHYIDVHADHLIFYPGARRVPVSSLGKPGNPFEKLVAEVTPKRADEYIVLLARPRSAAIVRTLRQVMLERGIDVGIELYEANRPAEIDMSLRGAAEQRP
jgi:hypothetical protein